jgi:hypothetical protein
MKATDYSITSAQDFLIESGLLQSLILDGLVIGLRRKLAAEGAVCCVRRESNLHVRAQLARRWQCSSAERIEVRIIHAILAINPYARIQGVHVRKRGCYIEAEIGVS